MNIAAPADLTALRIVDLPSQPSKNGTLGIVEGGETVPFAIARTFQITGMPPGGLRGQHAHKRCSQFMLCLYGVLSIHCDDGARSSVVRLDRPDKGLLVPPGIWIEVRSEADQSALLVLCDRPYEADDYIRDRGEFEVSRGVR